MILFVSGVLQDLRPQTAVIVAQGNFDCCGC